MNSGYENRNLEMLKIVGICWKLFIGKSGKKINFEYVLVLCDLILIRKKILSFSIIIFFFLLCVFKSKYWFLEVIFIVG